MVQEEVQLPPHITETINKLNLDHFSVKTQAPKFFVQPDDKEAHLMRHKAENPPPLPKPEDDRDEAIEAVSNLLRGIYDDLGKLKDENATLRKSLESKISLETQLDARKELKRVFSVAWEECFGGEGQPLAREHMKNRLGL